MLPATTAPISDHPTDPPPRPWGLLRAQRVRHVLLTLALGACAGACSNAWDAEYSCSGQEQTQSFFADDAQHIAGEKAYANTVDFHLRARQAMLKSSLSPIDAQADGTLVFGSHTGVLWVSGVFDPASGRLSTIESRQLALAGRNQTVRTTGQYLCRARSGG